MPGARVVQARDDYLHATFTSRWLRFVDDAELRDRLAQQADLCDMEGYAVAFAAREAGVPVRLVKLVSDDADESAGATWQETLADHARTLAAWTMAHL